VKFSFCRMIARSKFCVYETDVILQKSARVCINFGERVSCGDAKLASTIACRFRKFSFNLGARV